MNYGFSDGDDGPKGKGKGKAKDKTKSKSLITSFLSTKPALEATCKYI